MIYKTDFLKKSMDEVRDDPAFIPSKGQTFCNLACFHLAQKLGINLFWNENSDRPMLANEAVKFMDENPDMFSKFYSPVKASDLSCEGFLIFAAQHNIPHGHIAPIYPDGKSVDSEKWGITVPYVSNVGIKNEVMGLNWAFSEIPDFYLVIN